MRLHPGRTETYRETVADLAAPLQHISIRTRARDGRPGLVERVSAHAGTEGNGPALEPEGRLPR